MSDSQYTPVDEIPQILERARRAFLSGKARSVAFRKQQIAQVAYLVLDNLQRFIDALKLDIGRPSLETELTDIGPCLKDVRCAYDNVEKWAAERNADFNWGWFPMSPKIKPEPKGVALIISAYNLPIFLTLGPLTSAMAAGCAAVMKPSEYCVNTAKLLAELVPQYLDNDLYHVVQGGIAETTKLLDLRFDHIMYIGGQRVGRIVAQAAAKHLTPVTLELGGKNPVFVDPQVDPRLVARRILWGRFTNAGQICTAPEYMLVPRAFKDELVSHLKQVYHEFYPNGPEKSDSFARIITKEHTMRIKKLLDTTRGTIIIGGEVDIESKYVAPTIVDNVQAGDSLMSEEVFGPVLSIYPVEDIDEAIEVVQKLDHPLGVYVFSPDKKVIEKVVGNTRSGAALVNECMLSPAVPGFPVGGIGASGYGCYSSKGAFEQFSHQRVSVNSPSWVDYFPLWFRFPPYQFNSNYRRYLGVIYPNPPPRPKNAPRAVAAGAAALTESERMRWAFWAVCALIGICSVLLTSPYPTLLVSPN